MVRIDTDEFILGDERVTIHSEKAIKEGGKPQTAA